MNRLCACGCGEPVVWEHARYLIGHHRRKTPVRYVVEGRDYDTPCWVWQGAISTTGYGALRVGGKGHSAHHWYYVQAHGEVPAGLELDHLCRVRACVNPAHLEPVTRAENIRRGVAAREVRTHCIHGHPLDEANTIISADGRRRSCRTCRRAAGRAHARRRRLARQEAAA